MGMFDSVVVKCSCGSETEELQSKAGPCILTTYVMGTDLIPPEIIGDLLGKVTVCPDCGKRYKIGADIFTVNNEFGLDA